MKEKEIMKGLKKDGWNMRFDTREQELIRTIADITEGEENKAGIAGIVWEKRYSTTEADDRFGRWMRIGKINDMTVAICIKAVHLEKIKYVVKLPNNKGDESLQSDIMANSENEAMLAAEKHIAEYVANFYKITFA